MTLNPAQFGMAQEHYDKLSKLYGSGAKGVETIFGESPVGVPPQPKWETKSKQGLKYDPEGVNRAIRKEPPELQDFDPRTLHSSQRGLTSPGVTHYLEDTEYQQTGKTYADQGSIGNRYPVVLQRQESSGVTRNVVLSGHHRATAALLKGEPLRGIPVREDQQKLPHT